MNSQKKRGGGTVCFAHEKLWKLFTGAVTRIEACPRAVQVRKISLRN